MPNDGAHEYHCPDPVEGAANLETALPAEEESRDKTLVVAQSETGNHERDKRNCQEGVLHYFVRPHSQHLRSLGQDIAQVPLQIDQPVEHHQTDNHGNGDDVDLLDHIGSRCAKTLTADAVDRG